MSLMKAECNHKSFLERYDVRRNTRHTCYAILSIVYASNMIFLCTLINSNNSFYVFTLKPQTKLGSATKDRVGQVTGNAGICWPNV